MPFEMMSATKACEITDGSSGLGFSGEKVIVLLIDE